MEYGARLRNAVRLGLSKLTPEQVTQIRAEDSRLSHSELARRFGVTPKTVASIRKGTAWRQGASVFTWRP